MDHETLVLVVVTNLSTRLVVIPSRTETVADVSATIKAYHEAVFPKSGHVNVTAVEVELLGGRARLPDCIAIGLLFVKELQGVLYAQLTSSRANIAPEQRRLNLTDPPELDNVAGQQNHDGLFTPSPLGTHGQLERHDTPEPGRKLATTLKKTPTGPSSSSNLRRPVSDHTNREVLQTPGRNSDVVEGQVRKKRKVDNRKVVYSVGHGQAAVDEQIVESAAEKSRVNRGEVVVENLHEEPGSVASKYTGKDLVAKSLVVVKSRHESSSSDGSGCSQKPDHPVTEKLHEEPTMLISKSPEKGMVVNCSMALETQRRDSSGSSSQSGQAVTVKVEEKRGMVTSKPTKRDSVAKSLLAVNTRQKSDITDSSDSSSQSGHPVPKKVYEVPSTVTSKPAEKIITGRNELPLKSTPGFSSSDASGSTSSQDEPQTVSQQRSNAREKLTGVLSVSLVSPAKEVPSDGMQGLMVASSGPSLENRNSERKETRLSSGTTSGSTTCESSGQSENSREKRKKLQGEHHNTNNEKIVEIDPKEGSKSDSPEGSPVRETSDQKKSDGDSLQSSEDSESDNQGSSSEETDGSEDLLLRVTPRRLTFKTPNNGAGAGRTNGRRNAGGSLDLKYQHLLDSQDGFDELISLSQQKLKDMPGHQQEGQSVDELQNSVAPVPLADDSLSIDLVPDTQVEDWNGNISSQEFAAVEHLEENMNETKSYTVENVNASISIVQKDCGAKEPSQGGEEAVEDMKSKSVPSRSVKTSGDGEPAQGKGESITIKGNLPEKEAEPDKEPPHTRSEDSQQFSAEVHLARISPAEDPVEDTPSKKRKKKGISSLDGHVHIRFQDSSVDGGLKDQSMLQDSKNHGKSPVRDSSSLLLHNAGMHSTEKEINLLSPDQNMEASMGDADNVIIKQVGATVLGTQSDSYVAEVEASDPLSGRKKLGKRRHKALQVVENGTNETPQEHIRGRPDTVEKDEPSRGYSVLPLRSTDAPADNEHSRKTASSDYRALHLTGNIIHSATTPKSVKKMKLGLKRQRVHKHLRKEDNQGIVEECLDPTGEGAHEHVTSGPDNLLEAENDQTDLKEHVPEDKELHDQLSQRKLLELETPNSSVRKVKRNRAGEVKQPELRINSKEFAKGAQKLMENIDPGNVRSEVTPGQVSRGDSRDVPLGEDVLLLPENLTPVSNEIFKDEAATKQIQKEKRNVFVGSAENSSRLNQSSKKQRPSKQGYKVHNSASIHQEDFHVGLDKSPLQVQNMEEEKRKGKKDLLCLDKKHGNIAADKGVNMESLTIVLVETKKPRRKTAPKISSLDTSLMKDQKARQIQSKEGKRAMQVRDLSIQSGKDFPPLVTENLEEGNLIEDFPPTAKKASNITSTERAKAMLEKKSTSKKNREKLKVPRKQIPKSKVDDEMEQLDGPVVSAADDEHPISKLRTDWEMPSKFTATEKQKKNRGHEVKPSPKVGNRKGDQVQSITIAGNAEQEDQVSTPHAENVRKLSLKGSSARNSKKGPKNRAVVEEDSKRPDKKDNGSKSGGTLRSNVDGNREPAAGNKQGNPKKGKQGDSRKSMKTNALGRFVAKEVASKDTAICPYGCGKVYSMRTSAYYRHKLTCFLGRVPST